MKKNLTNLLQSLSLYGKKSMPGFTVLEFLIVLAIMLILIAIALPGLQQSRAKAEDEKRITDLRTITLGLEQYKQLCEEYPRSLDPNEACSDSLLNPSQKKLADYIPDLQKLLSAQTPSLFNYVPLTYENNNTECTGFHISVQLRDSNQNTTAAGDQNFDSTALSVCSGSNVSGFNGTLNNGLFDLHR